MKYQIQPGHHDGPKWNWHPEMTRVVNVRSSTWWHANSEEILNWLKVEGIYHENLERECPNIALCWDRQAAYFTLRWSQ